MEWKKRNRSEGDPLLLSDWGFVVSEEWPSFWASHPHEVRSHVARLNTPPVRKKLWLAFHLELLEAHAIHGLESHWLDYIESHQPFKD